MILSTSDKKACIASIVYIIISIFCFIFAQIYSYFSHGVTSYSMSSAFMIPACMGGVPYLFITVLKRQINRITFNLYAYSIAIFTIYAIMSGVLEIYGTTNKLMTIYPIAGFILLFASAIIKIVIKIRQKRESNNNAKTNPKI